MKKYKKLLIVLALSLCLIVGLFVVHKLQDGPIALKLSQYSVESTDINLHKAPIYESTFDGGCGKSDGFFDSRDCMAITDRYYGGSGNALSDLELIDQALEASGWDRTGNFPLPNDKEFDSAKSDGGSIVINYKKDDSSIALVYFSRITPPHAFSEKHRAKLEKLREDYAVGPDDYMIGVSALVNY